MSALFLELARTVLFLSSSPRTFRLRMIQPGFTPYYNKEFFNTIQKVHDKSPLNPVQMTVGQWYQYLLEDRVTRVKDKEGRRTARRCRLEELKPEVNWGRSFSLARLKGLSPDNKSVLLKVLHQLLPTGERVARLQPNKSPACSLCRTGPVDTLLHAIKDVSAKTAPSQNLEKL